MYALPCALLHAANDWRFPRRGSAVRPVGANVERGKIIADDYRADRRGDGLIDAA